MIVCSFVISGFFATTFGSQYESLSILLYISGSLVCVVYISLLIYLILSMTMKHEELINKYNYSFFYFNIKPSQWMFIFTSILTSIYEAIAVWGNIDGLEIEYKYIHGIWMIIVLLQSIVGVNNLSYYSKYIICIIILINMVAMITAICHDLSEQLELIEELDENYNNIEFSNNNAELIATSIFFANLEHFWGMMEACQEGLQHLDTKKDEYLNVKLWLKQKLKL